jgi:S1-C subfamily serine protease
LGITVVHESGAHGVRIDEAESGKPAATAGLKRLDVITDVDGKAIDSAEDLQDAIATAKNGHVAVRYMQMGTPAYMTVMVQF